MPKVTALRVLVVDDDPDVAASTAMILKYFGHEVVVARDGPTALQAVQAQEPDAVLLDIRMPRMNGCEVARRIVELCNQKRPRLIGVSGFGGAEQKEHCALAGIDILLQKPVDPEYLALVLQAILPPEQLEIDPRDLQHQRLTLPRRLDLLRCDRGQRLGHVHRPAAPVAVHGQVRVRAVQLA